MIRNVVFDMGNVLIDYTPELYARHFAKTEEDAQLLERVVFRGVEWAALDEGSITLESALPKMRANLPKRLHSDVEALLYHWFERIVSVPRMTRLVRALKDLGYKVYLLSNANICFDRYKHNLEAYPLLDGYIVSGFEGCIKPDAAIYRILLERFGLQADECLFVDDAKQNTDGAIRCGLKAHCFADRSVDALIQTMNELGIPLNEWAQ